MIVPGNVPDTTEPREVELLRIDLLDALTGARRLDEQNVQSLATSIGKQGLFHPITVIRAGERFTIAMGNHRKAATELLGHSHIEAFVWPEDTPIETVLLRSLHENHVRRDESLHSTIDRISGFMKAKQCTWTEAARCALVSKGTASKVKSAMKKLSSRALDVVRQKQVGVAIAYTVATKATNEQQQLQWLNAFVAGEMTRKDMESGTKTSARPVQTLRSIELSDGTITIGVSFPKTATYEQIHETLTKLKSKIAVQAKRETPVDLLPRLIK